jgi:hypothetical protein
LHRKRRRSYAEIVFERADNDGEGTVDAKSFIRRQAARSRDSWNNPAEIESGAAELADA